MTGGELEIVDADGAVRHQRRDRTALHQIDHQGREHRRGSLGQQAGQGFGQVVQERRLAVGHRAGGVGVGERTLDTEEMGQPGGHAVEAAAASGAASLPTSERKREYMARKLPPPVPTASS